MVQAEEKLMNQRLPTREEISWVAWAVSKDNSRQWLCGMSKNSVTDKGQTFNLKNTKFNKVEPSIFAAM